MHIGPSVGLRRIQTIADIVNSLNPGDFHSPDHFSDIVTIVGDLADGFVKDLNVAANPLCHIRSKYGVYFSTGETEDCL